MLFELTAPYSEAPINFATPFDDQLAKRFRPRLAYSGSVLQDQAWMGHFVAPLGLSERGAWGVLLAGMALQLNTLGPLGTEYVGQYVDNLLEDGQAALHHVAMRFAVLHAYRHNTSTDDLAHRLSGMAGLQLPDYNAHLRRMRVVKPDYHIDYGQWLVDEVDGMVELIAGNPDDRGYPDPTDGLSASIPPMPDLQGGY